MKFIKNVHPSYGTLLDGYANSCIFCNTPDDALKVQEYILKNKYEPRNIP